jgi:hypothetical protein
MTLRIEDRLDIGELIARLCQALDFSRPQDFVDLFIASGAYQATTSVAAGEQLKFRHQGRDQLRTFAESAALKRRGLGRHWTGNVVIRPSGDGAEATSYVLFVGIDAETGERTITISGIHRDQFTKTTDGWRFVQRTIVADL